ncbi:hypothetical protein HK105_204871 [Polyrhizophydium stewartii]|uniref:SAM-dependent RNA methyltransferase n=1 Tax=Polyrhizophydium stewartii TaxID=2732419 RepID=A0ABR4N823_9FUNG|nr:hypothetical protein HK105_006802 [Polyrhizophydium stewartii]
MKALREKNRAAQLAQMQRSQQAQQTQAAEQPQPEPAASAEQAAAPQTPAKRFKYVVEHLEEEIEGWSELEYRNMLANVGHGNLWLSHVSESVARNPPASLAGAVVSTNSIQTWEGVDLSRVLLADPAATQPLSPEDAGNYDYILFGGILGDDPPRDRTKELRVMGFATRHLGKEQMTTDTAVLVSQIVLEKGVPLDQIDYVDRPEIKLGRRETVIMPFRYIRLPDGQPRLPPGMLEHLKRSNDLSLN